MIETTAPPIPLTQRRAWDSLMQWLISPLDSDAPQEETEEPPAESDACRGECAA